MCVHHTMIMELVNIMNTRNCILFLVCLLLHSCTLWGPAEWRNLKDREFTFARFTYSHLSAGKSRALSAMRSFNLEPIVKSLEKKHGISIDTRAFEAFLKKGELSGIAEQGILMTNSYIWDIGESTANRAEIEIKVNYGDDMRIMNYTYQVALKVGGKIRAIYFDNVTDEKKIIERILAHIGAGISEKDFAAQKHAVYNGKIPGEKLSGRRYETEGKIMDMIDEYLNNLTPENRKKFKEELIRHLGEDTK